jgi:hypothetical protein
MDFLRSCYSTKMKFDQGGGIIADIQWYWADSGAKLWDGPNAFSSANWDDNPYSQQGLGEIWNAPQTYNKGAAPYPSSGTGRWCGKKRWFSEGVPPGTPPVSRTPSGQPACCGGPPGLLVGGTSQIVGVYPGSGGLRIGGSVSLPVLCQPWQPFGFGHRSLVRLLTGLSWASTMDTTTVYQAGDGPFGSGNQLVLNHNAVSCSGLLFSTVAELFFVPPYSGHYLLSFVSFNASTNTGIYQVPSGAPLYANEYFSFVNPP